MQWKQVIPCYNVGRKARPNQTNKYPAPNRPDSIQQLIVPNNAEKLKSKTVKS